MPDIPFCNKVVRIPQFLGTCWFNAILMAFLYSQNSRKLLLNNKKLFKNKDELSQVFIKILKKYYITHDKVYEYYDVMRPEKILSYFKIDRLAYEYIVKNGYFMELFIGNFISFLNCSYLTIDYSNNKLAVGITDNIGVKIINDRYSIEFDYSKLTDEYFENLKKEITQDDLPDYLVVNVWNRGQFFENVAMTTIEHLLQNGQIGPKILLDTYVKTQGILELEDEITYKNEKYIMDSCILGNFNLNINLGHAIAGLTCKGKRYVYNGWIRITQDPNIIDNARLVDADKLPCELMEMDWNLKDPNSEFCLNHAGCGLKKVFDYQGRNLCFSFGKGTRSVIYVRKSKRLMKSLDKNVSSSYEIKDEKDKKQIKISSTNIDNTSSNINSSLSDNKELKKKLINKLNDKLKKKLNIKLCNKWNKNKKINPITKTKLGLNTSTYKTIKTTCKKILDEIEEVPSYSIDDNIDLTLKDCKKWVKNPKKHPLTGKVVNKKSSTYKELNKTCKKILDDNKTSLSSTSNKKSSSDNESISSLLLSKKIKPNIKLNKKLCMEWNKNKLINPITKRPIKKNGPTYNMIKQYCIKLQNKKDKSTDEITSLKSKSISKSNTKSSQISTSSSSTSSSISSVSPELKIDELNKEYCLKWEKNKNINPLTLKRLTKGSKSYKQLENGCKIILSPLKNIEILKTEKDRIENYDILRKYINKITQKKITDCIVYNAVKKNYYIFNKLLLKYKISKRNKTELIYISSYDNKQDRIVNYAIKILNNKNTVFNIKPELRTLEYLTNLNLDLECPHFIITYDIFKCNRKKIKNIKEYPKDIIKLLDKKGDLIFILTELTEGNLDSFINKIILKNLQETKTLFLNTLAQIFLAIIFFHNKVNAIHADVHAKNFQYFKTSGDGYYHYNLFGTDYYLKDMGYLWVLCNFGMAVPFMNSDEKNIYKKDEITKRLFNYNTLKKKRNIDFLNYFGKANKYNITFDLELILNKEYIFGGFPKASYITNIKSVLKREILDKYKKYDTNISKITDLDKEILKMMVRYIPSFTTVKPFDAKIINSNPYILY